MGVSLLSALGLPELAVPTPKAYVDTAVRLALAPAELAALRQRVAKGRDTSPLFDTQRWVAGWEAAQRLLFEHRLSSAKLGHVIVRRTRV
jgi:predicted O-linked N-acetylglucosamine transferase (SPINDLY family)